MFFDNTFLTHTFASPRCHWPASSRTIAGCAGSPHSASGLHGLPANGVDCGAWFGALIFPHGTHVEVHPGGMYTTCLQITSAELWGCLQYISSGHPSRSMAAIPLRTLPIAFRFRQSGSTGCEEPDDQGLSVHYHDPACFIRAEWHHDRSPVICMNSSSNANRKTPFRIVKDRTQLSTCVRVESDKRCIGSPY
ncbi:hypothetical protein FA13DRAFT_1194727 [Coprinellus micaceus]|uniref:Uncharacterized protein n=1 Tax=Coprinellus micaceus TaxID=71717 RepID=A0A4Y7RBM9_COPMI|nr:hypothetical protein FA13DRAFT_1194727 [Coprinellus micaceus]